jgi:hypothetical protein
MQQLLLRMKADAIAALRRHRDGRVERSRRPCDGLATLDRAGRSTDDSWLQPRGTARAQHVAEIRYRRIHATKPAEMIAAIRDTREHRHEHP